MIPQIAKAGIIILIGNNELVEMGKGMELKNNLRAAWPGNLFQKTSQSPKACCENTYCGRACEKIYAIPFHPDFLTGTATVSVFTTCLSTW